MKKFLVVLLILAVAGGAFAQLKATVTVDVNPEILKVATPTGDAAKPEVRDGKAPYQGTARTDFLSSTANGTMGKENELRLALNYTGEGYSAYLRLNGDKFIRPYEYATDNPMGSFVNGSYKNVSPVTLLTTTFDEWNVQGTYGILSAYLGNTAPNRGKTNAFRFQNFSDYLKVKIDNFGILAPTAVVTYNSNTNEMGYSFGFTDLDNNNFLRGYSFTPYAVVEGKDAQNNPNGIYTMTMGGYRRSDYPYFSLTAAIPNTPITVAAAGDIGYNSGVSPNANGWSNARVNGAFRVSGEKIADMVNFDVFYKFRGGDSNTDKNKADFGATPPKVGNGPQPDGSGKSVHSFGLYAGATIMEGLGVAIGYSGMVASFEKENDVVTARPTSAAKGTLTYASPFYNGIDIRAQFTGIEKLTVTFNNNISFAAAKRAKDEDDWKQVYGVMGELLDQETSESWFALYNALGANYKLSDQLTASVQLGNRLGIYTWKYDGTKAANYLDFADSKSTMTIDNFAATVFASYVLNSHLTMEGGLQFLVRSYGIKGDQNVVGEAVNKTSFGDLNFAIPLRFKIVY